METHNECRIKYKCPSCVSNFTRINNVIAHCSEHHPELGKIDIQSIQTENVRSTGSYVCTFCGKRLARKANLDGHLKRYHNSESTCVVEPTVSVSIDQGSTPTESATAESTHSLILKLYVCR